MKKIKKRIIIIVTICIVVLIGALVADKIMSKTYLSEIKYEKIIEKIKNKEDLILCISQTECTHCNSYKPKLEKVANKYKIDIYYIDVDKLKKEEVTELKEYVNYSSTPTTIFLKKGEEKTQATRINGDTSEEKIIKKLKTNKFID